MRYWQELRRRRGTEPALFYLAVVTLASLAVFPLVDVALQVAGVTHGVTLYDFTGAFYTAGERFLAGESLYAPVHNPYVYPPVVVLGFVPFTVLPPYAAGLAWDVVSFALLAAGVRYLLVSFDVRPSRVETAGLVWCLFGFYPTLLWLKAGQVSGSLVALLCVAVGLAERSRRESADASRRRALLSGAATALAAAVKPFYATAGAYLLRDRYRLLGAAAAVVSVVGLSTALVGVDTFRAYVEVLAYGKGWGVSPDPGGISGPLTDWGPFMFRPLAAFGSAALAVRLALVGFVALLALASRMIRSPDVDRAVLALGLVTVPLGSPVPDLFAVNAVIPAALVTLVVELRHDEGLAAVPVAALLLVHVHAYVLGFLAGFGYQFVPALRLLQPALPLLQPGVWGVFALFGLLVYRVVVPLRAFLGDARGAAGV